MKTRSSLMLAAGLALAPWSRAAACRFCDMMRQRDEGRQASQPSEPPADITKNPALDADDLSFLLALDEGRRYTRVGNNIADAAVLDPWARLLRPTDLEALLAPWGQSVVASLREKAKKGKLAEQDFKLASHHFWKLNGIHEQADRDFLKSLADKAKPEVAVSTPSARSAETGR